MIFLNSQPKASALSVLQKVKGFTLVELLVTMVVSMVVLGGLMTSFIQQNSEYKYQNKRIDVVQDAEFALKFIAEDLRSSLVGDPLPGINIAPVGAGSGVTTSIDFYVWDADESCQPNKRAHRKYVYNAATKSLRYDREIDSYDAGTSTLTVGGADATINDGSQILPNVTFFKIFKDANYNTVGLDATRKAAYTGIPSAQSDISFLEPAVANVSGYTIVIELEVDAGYKNGAFIDVKGTDVGVSGHKRVWRYVQVYPMVSVN